jgi:hypothetical protein
MFLPWQQTSEKFDWLIFIIFLFLW